MAKTKYTLAKTASPPTDFYTGPVTLRMRTKEDTELIVTDFQTAHPVHEYILVTIQNCKYMDEDDDEEGVPE